MLAAVSLDRANGIPLWRQIADCLKAEIETEVLAADVRLPSEPTLADRFKVNRHTIRQAVNALSNDGFVRIERGRGTFVEDRPLEVPFTTEPYLHQRISEAALLPGYEIIASGHLKADPVQSRGLRINVGAPIAMVEALGKWNGHAIMISRNYFPLERCPNILAEIKRCQSVPEALAAVGHTRSHRALTRISAEQPGSELAAQLQIGSGRPVLKVLKLESNDDDLPLAFSISYFKADACVLSDDRRDKFRPS